MPACCDSCISVIPCYQVPPPSGSSRQVGIAIGCSVSPILFIMAFEVILIGARQVVGVARLPTRRKLPPLRSYMDDITCSLQTARCTSRLQLYSVPKGNVASEAVQSYFVGCQQDGSKSQLICPQVAGASKGPLVDQPVWKQRTQASHEA